MALLKYFNKATVLPNLDGPLSDNMPSAAISSANNEVKDLVVRESDVPDSQLTNGPVKHPRGQYLSYTEEEKARITKRAAESGVTNTLNNMYDVGGFIPRYISKIKSGCGQCSLNFYSRNLFP